MFTFEILNCFSEFDNFLFLLSDGFEVVGFSDEHFVRIVDDLSQLNVLGLQLPNL